MSDLHKISKIIKRKIFSFFLFLYYSGFSTLYSLKGKNTATILIYHLVDNIPKYSISPKNFENQIRYLNSKKKVIPLTELVSNIKNNKKNPKGSIIITFDDGYKNNYVNAYPVLKKYNMPFTIFLATDYIGHNKKKWEGYEMLSWEDVKEMAKNNVSFGAHTCSHCKLTDVSQEVATKEIIESKHIIENKIGKKIDFFSFPYGRRGCYSEKIKQILKENGFECAVTANYGKNYLGSDLFELKRIGVNEPLWTFKYNVSGIEEIFQKIYRFFCSIPK